MRLRHAALLLCLVASACAADREDLLSGPGASGDPGSTDGPPTVTVPQIEGGPVEEGPSALLTVRAPGMPEPLVPEEELRSGGPPPDGIPPIDEPKFHRASDVDFLEEAEPVLSIEVDGEARAYPVQVLIWHEIVNDTFDKVPVTITYCPLCNSAVAFDRRVDDRVVTFGTSGLLYQSALVMYDRQTSSLWSQFSGVAVAGMLTGTQLRKLPVAMIAWGDWLDANPDGLVLSRDTGEERPYGQNPYPGYDNVNEAPFLFKGEVDGRLAAKERVVGLAIDTEPTAVRLEPLLDSGVVETTVGGRPVVVWALPGTASALETFDVADGRDVGATGVFFAEHEQAPLRFTRAAGGFVDDRTGSTWNVLGEAVEGALAGTRLERLEHVDTFWFAWAAFSPQTRLLP
jgi:hypothetical protein